MKLKYLILYVLLLLGTKAFSFQNENEQNYLVIETDTLHSKYQVGYNICKTEDSLKKEVYIVNVRYKLNAMKSSIGSDADLIFVFYIFPKLGHLKLVEFRPSESILGQKMGNIFKARNLLANTESIDNNHFIPLISHQGKLYKFVDADLFGQAFNLIENVQYFPEYKILASNRYELNLLNKPYTEQDIAVLQNQIKTDTSGFKHFDVDGLNGKWNIRAINKPEKTIDFWMHLVTVATGSYSFGRFAEEIKLKLNVGIIGFGVEPLRPVFDERHIREYQYKLVTFKFKNLVDVIPMLN